MTPILRLRDFGYTQKIGDCWVPQMIGYHDELMVVEMDLMQKPPYIIDFAKVRLNSPPEFSEQVLEDNEKQGQELFGGNWHAVQVLLEELESVLNGTS